MATQKTSKAQVAELSAASTPIAFPFPDLPHWGSTIAKDLSLDALYPKMDLVANLEGWKELPGMNALVLLPVPGFGGAPKTPANGADSAGMHDKTESVVTPSHPSPVCAHEAQDELAEQAIRAHRAKCVHEKTSPGAGGTCMGLGPLQRGDAKDGTVWLSGGTRWAKAMQRNLSSDSSGPRVMPAAEKNLLVRAKSKTSMQSQFSAASTISGLEESASDRKEDGEAQEQNDPSAPSSQFKRSRSNSISSTRSTEVISFTKSTWSISSKLSSPFSKRNATSVQSA